MSALASTPAGAAILALYGHPFSSYTQKVLTALYENGTPFELHNLDPAAPDKPCPRLAAPLAACQVSGAGGW